MNQSGEVGASAFKCLLGVRGLPTKKSETIWRLPWTYSFLRRTLKLANCCDRPEESIGYLFTSLGTYLLFLLGYVLLCRVVVAERCGSCSGHINQVGAFWGKCSSWLAWHQRNVCAWLQQQDNCSQLCTTLSSYNKSPRIQLSRFLNSFLTGPVHPERVLQQMGPSEPAPTMFHWMPIMTQL
jgi:hypothetical protein